jgi:glycerophosphoryl diester phosphodiesterase
VSADDPCADALTPLARAHAHNDYDHEQPLLDALEHGFTSVEADIWLVEGELLVAHDLEATQPGRTLAALYLDPLAERVRTQGGVVHPCFQHSVQLLIDIKSEGAPTYRALHDMLARYPQLLSTFTWDTVREQAVTVVISGNRPLELMARQRVRYAAYDGRASDLSTDADAAFIPLVSDNWTNLFGWIGVGAIPEAEHQKLQNFVTTAHQRGRRVRFWATPEDRATREAVWSALLEAGVDYINTDDLAGLETFLLTHDTTPSVPQVDWFGDYNALIYR